VKRELIAKLQVRYHQKTLAFWPGFFG